MAAQDSGHKTIAPDQLRAPPKGELRAALLVIGAALVAFIGSDAYFTFLEDETTIVTAARQPAVETLRLFWTGRGQHEHPPLSDLGLHFWLAIGGSAPWLVRLPSVLFYLAGLVLLGWSARKLGGESAFAATLYTGLLWPFAFHFARMAGWYSFCFFLVAGLTLTYLRYLERPGWRRLLLFLIPAGALVYSNYYGWAIIGCLAFDICVRRHPRAKRLLLAASGILIVIYIPIWAVFRKELLNGTHMSSGPPIVSKAGAALYCLYALFVSESAAPWFWYWSIPASLAIVVSIGAAARLLSTGNRRLLFYFGALFAGMAVLGITRTKRLLFISDWLLLSLAVALANRGKPALRGLLAVSLGMLAAIGWVGVLARKYYATPHFIEPWAAVAEEAATSVRNGEVVISNSRPFRFYVNYSLWKRGMLASPFTPGWVEDPRILAVGERPVSEFPRSGTVLFVNGVNTALLAETGEVEGWLRANCAPLSTKRLTPDSGFALKSRFFQGFGQRPYRILLERYACAAQPLPESARPEPGTNAGMPRDRDSPRDRGPEKPSAGGAFPAAQAMETWLGNHAFPEFFSRPPGHGGDLAVRVGRQGDGTAARPRMGDFERRGIGEALTPGGAKNGSPGECLPAAGV